MACYKQVEWEGKFFRHGRCCYYCGTPLTLRGATKDHVVPIVRGGSDELFNIVPCCWTCNRLKGEMTANEFRQKYPDICKSSTAIPNPKSGKPVISYEENNEPHLLERLITERETRNRWWRTA